MKGVLIYMILYKSNPISIAQENCIMLEIECDDAFVYLSKSTYEQALLLADRMENEITYLQKLVLGDDIENNKIAQDYFFENAPEPVNILAPYLGLVQPVLSCNMRELCGVLHMLSMQIDFNLYTKVPKEVRVGIVFTKNSIRRYEQNWRDIEMKINVKEIDLEHISVEAVADILSKMLPALGINSMNVVQNSSAGVQNVNNATAVSQTETVEEDDDADELEAKRAAAWAKFNESLKSLTTEIEDDETREKEEKEEKEVKEVKEVKEDMEKQASMSEEEKELSEIDKIISVLGAGSN